MLAGESAKLGFDDRAIVLEEEAEREHAQTLEMIEQELRESFSVEEDAYWFGSVID